MSAAAAPTAPAAAAPAGKGRKKLIAIAAAVLLLLALGGGTGLWLLKKKPAGADADEAVASAAEAPAGHKPDLRHPPTFLPLDPFVVNLADREAERYAQVGVTFEVEDAKFAEQMKQFMPALRNSILMILAHKSSRDLQDRSGKEQLAAEILREASRSMGLPIDDEPEAPLKVGTADDEDDDTEAKAQPKKKAKKRKPPTGPNPIRRVHFSNFIVQ